MQTALSRARLLLLIVCTALVLAGPAAAEGQSQEWKEGNLKWTLPVAGFQFGELSEDLKKNGYVALVTGARDMPIQAYLTSRKKDGLGLPEFQEEVVRIAKNMVGNVTGSATKQDTLSGIPATLVRVQGKNEEIPQYVQAWIAEQGERFYVLMVRNYHGIEQKRWKDLDELKRGVRLLEGAGPEEAAATEPPPALSADEVGGAGGVSPDQWPEKGPKREGNLISIPTHNIKWQLPEETPFKITRVISDESVEGGLFLRVAAERPAPEGSETPLQASVSLLIGKRPPGSTPAALVNNSGVQENVGNMLAERNPGGTRIEDDVKAGAYRSAMISMTGKTKEGGEASVQVWFCCHATTLYEVRSVTLGARDGLRIWEDDIAALLGGLAPINPVEPAPGPLARKVPTNYIDRGLADDRETVMKGYKLEFKKPEGIARLKSPGEGVDWAVEGRSEDGSAYLFIDCQTIDRAAMMTSGPSPESIAADRATAWEAAAGDSATTSKKGKPPVEFKARFGKAKGIGWHFTGKCLGQPIVEYGYVVTWKQKVYVIHVQFVGEDAEKKLEKTYKTITKSWKWVK
jgi:hypothetical protein